MNTIAFTGTRSGMNDLQKEKFKKVITELNWTPQRFLHGDCVGADADAHDIIAENFPEWVIEIFPGHPANQTDPDKAHENRAFKDAKIIHPPMPFMKRNQAMVMQADMVIACPYSETKRGGTWKTIELAQKQLSKKLLVPSNLLKVLIILFPDRPIHWEYQYEAADQTHAN